MNQVTPITFNVTVAEADVILNALGQRPFGEVHRLVAKLIQQANTTPPVVDPHMNATPSVGD